jgi:HEAT repeat protein
LAEALDRETNARVREAIFTALLRIASPECVDVVLPYLRSDDAALRTSAIDVLRSIPKSVETRLVELFADPDSDVRLLRCELARELEPSKAQRLLLSLIGTEKEANVCSAAIEVLAEIGDAAALPHLAACCARFPDDPFIAFAVQAAADRIASSGDL